jgi:hypothetical protein
MTHLVFLVEGYSDSLRKFEKDWHGKIYANGKAKLRIREVKLYTFAVNEEGLDECLADFKALCMSYELVPFKDKPFLHFFLKFVKFFAPLVGLNQIKDAEIKSKVPNREEVYRADKAVLAHFIPLGKISDPRILKDCNWGKKGGEIV